MILKTNDSEDLTAREIFQILVEYFQDRYPRRDLKMRGSMVYVDGKQMFNIEGFNMLYNVKRLCECLEDELI